MDSLQGIPVEYKLDAFNMPRTGTTLCHPKIGYVNLTRNPALSIHLWATLMEIAHTLPKYQTRTYSDIQSSIPTAATCLSLNLRTLSLTCPTTHDAISTFSTSHNSISSQYLQPFMSLAAPKANPIFHAANKNLIPKIPFDYRHLTSSSSSFYFSQLSEGG